MNGILPDFDSLWDYSRPAESESAFRALLDENEKNLPAAYRAELLTQIARAQGLQRRFGEAHQTLNELEPSLHQEVMAVVRVRYLLERGRVFNSAGASQRAIPLFMDAWDAARRIGRDDFAVDAAHMLGIVEKPDAAMAWNHRAFELAETSSLPGARRWQASLANNIGWSLHAQGDFPRAMEKFEAALRFRQEQGKPRDINVARWCVARCLRSLGHLQEAISRQREMEREIESDPSLFEEPGYVYEEIAECLVMLGRDEEARHYFVQAFQRLSKDPWLSEREPLRIDKLRRLGA